MPEHFDHCQDLFRGELSKNQVILWNVHLRTEITGDLCGVWDKTEVQRWNKSPVHNCYVTMRSICRHGDKSLAPVWHSPDHIYFLVSGNVHCTWRYYRETLYLSRGYLICQGGGGDMKIVWGWRFFFTSKGGGEVKFFMCLRGGRSIFVCRQPNCHELRTPPQAH